MKNMKKFMALALALVMVFALSANAFAVEDSSSYGYLTLGEDTVSTYVVEPGDYVFLQVRPGYITEVNGETVYIPTSFADDDEADAVGWSVIPDTAEGIYVDYSMASVDSDNNIVSEAGIFIDEDATIGTASIKATYGEGDDAISTNITLVVDDGTHTTATGIGYKFYNRSTPLLTGTAGTNANPVSAYDYHGYTDFVNALDLIAYLQADNSVALSNYYVLQYPQYCFLDSVTISGNTLAWNQTTGAAWFYRVYDASGNLIEYSENVDMDSFMLMDGYTVVYKYGLQSEITFSDTL